MFIHTVIFPLLSPILSSTICRTKACERVRKRHKMMEEYARCLESWQRGELLWSRVFSSQQEILLFAPMGNTNSKPHPNCAGGRHFILLHSSYLLKKEHFVFRPISYKCIYWKHLPFALGWKMAWTFLCSTRFSARWPSGCRWASFFSAKRWVIQFSAYYRHQQRSAWDCL